MLVREAPDRIAILQCTPTDLECLSSSFQGPLNVVRSMSAPCVVPVPPTAGITSVTYRWNLRRTILVTQRSCNKKNRNARFGGFVKNWILRSLLLLLATGLL